MGGALSYENLFLVNGVNVNENLRGQARLLYIEDAIQETKVSTGSISAEYGRFQGGVVNMITKSGGNKFCGIVPRLVHQRRLARRCAPKNDEKIDKTVPVYEATLGGPIMKDKVWFFGAGRYSDEKKNQTLDTRSCRFTKGTKDQRGEGKLTYALNPMNKVVGSYTKKAADQHEQHVQRAVGLRQPLQQQELRHARGRQLLERAQQQPVLRRPVLPQGDGDARAPARSSRTSSRAR